MFGHSVSGGHPSHCRPSPVLLDLFLRMSPLQVITHPCTELAWCCWTSSSAVAFSAVTHPTADRARCCFTFFFDCLLFRRPSIQVPTRPGAAGLHLRLSRFPAVTHPTVDRARCCLTFFFDCLLFRWSPIQVPTQTGAGGLYFRCPVFGGHPSQCRPSPALLDIFLRLPPPLPVVTHPSADPEWCCWTSSSAVAFPAVTHPTADRAWCGLSFFFDCLLFRWSPI